MEIYCEPYKCFWLKLVKGHKRFLKAIVTSWVYLSSLKDEKLISVKNPSHDVRHGDNLEWGKLKDVLSACTWLGRGRHQSQKWFLERCMIKIVWTLNYNEHSLGNPCQISIGGLLVMAQAQWWGHFLKLFGVISMFHEFGYKCQVRDLFWVSYPSHYNNNNNNNNSNLIFIIIMIIKFFDKLTICSSFLSLFK